MQKSAFTVIELIFVIVILGILASVALPKFTGMKESADIAKGRSDVAAIRAAIMNERQSQIIKGTSSFIPKLTEDTNATILFKGDGTRKLLTYGIKVGEWTHPEANKYKYTIDGTETEFTYDSDYGTFTCTSGSGNCDKLVD